MSCLNPGCVCAEGVGGWVWKGGCVKAWVLGGGSSDSGLQAGDPVRSEISFLVVAKDCHPGPDPAWSGQQLSHPHHARQSSSSGALKGLRRRITLLKSQCLHSKESHLRRLSYFERCLWVCLHLSPCIGACMHFKICILCACVCFPCVFLVHLGYICIFYQ